MNPIVSPSRSIRSIMVGLMISLFATLAAVSYEPRLLPLALFAGPILVNLAVPSGGRRV